MTVNIHDLVVGGAVALSISVAASASSFVDVLDDDGSWNLIGGSFVDDLYNPGQGTLEPSAGDWFWGSSYHLPFTLGIEKTYQDQFVEAGLYQLEIDTSDPFERMPVPFNAFTEFGLTGAPSATVDIVSADTPPPDTPDWTTWRINYTVPADSPDLGNPIGFRALATLSPGPGEGYSVMLDNIRVQFTPIPSPSAVALLATLALARRQTR